MIEATKRKIDRKARLKIPPVPVPKQDPKERIKNWNEVYLGYDLPTAQLEATRCIQCPAAPCQDACPLHNDIPGALLKLEDGDVLGAAEVFRETNPASDMCGRLCPQEQLCEGSCVVGKKAIPVAIGKLEAFIADQQHAKTGRPIPTKLPQPTGKLVAVVGSGPAGLYVAETLALQGHGVKVFEVWPKPGGVLRYGIPNFKMHKHHIDDLVDYLHGLGVQFAFNVRVGHDLTIDEMFDQGFHAVFLGHGAGEGRRMNVPGEDLQGIYMATEFLVRVNVPPEDLPSHLRRPIDVGKRAVVVGGADTAMDCVRSAMRTGADEVVCAYRRTVAEMGGREEERRHAHEEGVQFHYLTVPVRFIADEEGHVRSVRFQRMELGELDDSGRPRPMPIIGSEFDVAADTVVVAIGYKVEKLIFQTTSDLDATDWGTVIADESGQTSRPGVFAAGDNVRGADLVVTALADAKRAADAIDRFLLEEKAAAA
jgi:glutamate synthase (NADPH/NADH) small chain